VCDGINDPGGPRRCPSQRGERRREYRRALYAAQKAATIADPAGPEPTHGDHSAIATDEQVREACAAASALFDAFAGNQNVETLRRYESAVRYAGELVATQVDAEIAARLDPTELDRLDADAAALEAAVIEHAREKRAVEQRVHDLTAKLRRLPPPERVQYLDEIDELVNDFNQRSRTLQATAAEIERRRLAYGAAEGRVAAEVLGRYREYGTVVPDVHQSTTKRAQQVTAAASTVFPADWMTASNNSRRMIVKESKDRAYYQHQSRVRVSENTDYDYSDDPTSEQTWATRKEMPPAPEKSTVDRMRELDWPDGDPKWVAVRDPETRRWGWKLRMTYKGTVTMSELRVPSSASSAEDTHRTAIHEMSHRVETFNVAATAACLSFRERRTTSVDGIPHTLQQYAKGEYVRPDDFVDVYVGKQYQSSVHTEVLSMGMESVFGGSHGGLKGRHGYRADPEHRHLILGLCATA